MTITTTQSTKRQMAREARQISQRLIVHLRCRQHPVAVLSQDDKR